MQEEFKYSGSEMFTDIQDAVKGLTKGLPCGKFTVKLAMSDEEKREVFRLRYLVFNEELGEGIPENEATGLDVDDFDAYCDHLTLLAPDGKVVATYRLLYGPNRPASGFYTESEFNMQKLPADFSKTVELGRACIHPDYRQQTTLMTLLWGLHCYCVYRSARYLLGCGTLIARTPDIAEATFQLLKEQGHVQLIEGVEPHEKNQFIGNPEGQEPDFPKLLKLYLEFGAKIFSRPAYDPVFKCYDLLMMFDMQHLSVWGNELLIRFDKRLMSKAD